MKKTLLFAALVSTIIMGTMGCSQQNMAKNYGGDYTVELEPGQKLMNITWKESDLWYLTRPMTETDVAETYEFQEDSTWGVLEGTITIVESK